MEFLGEKVIQTIESLGRQLDPEYKFKFNISPKAYFAQYSAKDYIRVVILIGAYSLIIRPFLEKGMKWLRDRPSNTAPIPVPIDVPAWEDLDDDSCVDKMDWGRTLRKRAREQEKDREVEDDDVAELDRYLD